MPVKVPIKLIEVKKELSALSQPELIELVKHLFDKRSGAAAQSLSGSGCGAWPGNALHRRGDGHRHDIRARVSKGADGCRHAAAR